MGRNTTLNQFIEACIHVRSGLPEVGDWLEWPPYRGGVTLCRTEILGILSWDKSRNDHSSVNVTTADAMIAFTSGRLHAILIYQASSVSRRRP